MRNPKQVLRQHNISTYQSIKGAEIMANAIAEDILTILNTASVKPLHERIAEYINFKH